MTLIRTLLTSLTLPVLLSACQVYSGKPDNPAPSIRLQGQLQVDGEQLHFTPCQEQRRFLLVDAGETGIRREAATLAADTSAPLFADLAGQLSASQSNDDGRFEISRIYRLQGEGHGCDDLNFKRLALRASGNEPFWQVEVGNRGLVLNRPDQEPLALPYLEEQMPDGRLHLSSEANGQRLELWVAPQRCVDNMSGALNHLSAELRVDGQVMRGCAHYGATRN